ncbi:Vesicular glutamate transporter 2.1, partial [Gonioctena quinquepunctata]
FIVPAIALIFLGNCGPESSSKALVLLVIAVGINALSMSGFFINHMELSPNHAGVVMGICMELGSVCALMAPLLVQVLVTEEHNTEQWKLIFYSSSAIYFVTNFSFVFFGSSKIQPWNDENMSKDAESM